MNFSCFWSALAFFHTDLQSLDAVKALCYPGACLNTQEIADTQHLTESSPTAACNVNM